MSGDQQEAIDLDGSDPDASKKLQLKQIRCDGLLARIVANYVHAGLCERYPIYVVDFVMWPHRANPNHRPPGGSGRIVTTWDGYVLGQRARHAPKLKDVFDHPEALFKSTPLDNERSVLERRRSEWFDRQPQWHRHQSAHDFASMYCLGVSAKDATDDANAGPSPDTWYAMSSRINVVDVQAVGLRPASVASFVSRSLLLVPFPNEAEARLLQAATACDVDHAESLAREAVSVADISDRATAVALRTLAEVVGQDLSNLIGTRWTSLDAGISEFETWLLSQHGSQAGSGEGKRIRRELPGLVGGFVHSLNQLREHGNQVHEPAMKSPGFDIFECAVDLLRKHRSVRDLVQR